MSCYDLSVHLTLPWVVQVLKNTNVNWSLYATHEPNLAHPDVTRGHPERQ